jgi:hypothetical protein
MFVGMKIRGKISEISTGLQIVENSLPYVDPSHISLQ